MNYAAHYDRLIERARCRVLEGYRERHHIVPKHMGGGNEPANIVALTAEEHYVAHQLLVKMYPEVRGLVWASLRLARACLNNKAYGWLRRRHAAIMRGRILSAETRAKIGAAQKGKVITQEQREKISSAKLGKSLSLEHRSKVSASLLGNRRGLGTKLSVEHRAKISEFQRERKRIPHSAETKAKIGSANRGHAHSQETRAKMSAAHLGRPHSPEHRANLAAANRARALRNRPTSSPSQSTSAAPFTNT